MADPGFAKWRRQPLSSGLQRIITVRNSRCGKVMFSQASVILSTGRGGVWQTPPGKHPPGRPPGQTPPPWADTLPGQTTYWPDNHPPGDGHCSRWYASYWNAFFFGKIFAENCIKMKEIGPIGGCTSLAPPPLDPPMLEKQHCDFHFQLKVFKFKNSV